MSYLINPIIIFYILLQYSKSVTCDNFEALNQKSPKSLNDISCHKVKCYDKCRKYILPNLDDSFHPPKKTAYFIETSCLGSLNSRFACAVEAVANTNPNWIILVIFAGPLKTEFWNSMTFYTLNSTANVYFYRLNTTEFTKGTPFEYIFADNLISKSLYPVGHMSDFLKILVLYKYGGLYLDLDTIVLKSLDPLPKNFIAKQALDEIASGIMAAGRDGVGAVFTGNSVRDLAENFTLSSWGGNSNDVYNRTLENMCNTTDVTEMNEEKCQGFHVLPHELFYPVHWRDWSVYYSKGTELLTSAIDTRHVSNKLFTSVTYTHHMWNGYGARVTLQPDMVFAKIAKKACPQIYNLFGDKFGM